ncbi:winged helix-turn-helix transcriptional regulator, partial [Escherichia coli]|nr:winged helix-turn-helix transcriptional regulator [Escherichia coli]
MVFLTAGHLIPDRYVLVDAHQQPVDFTQGEYGLLLALAQNSRRVLICEQLLDLIHGETTEVFDRTIDVLIMNRPGFPGECFICELRLPDHRFRWKHNKLFLLLPEEYGPAFPA